MLQADVENALEYVHMKERLILTNVVAKPDPDGTQFV